MPADHQEISKTTSRKRASAAEPELTPADELRVGATVDELAAIYLLDSIKGFGPQKFKELHQHRMAPADLLANPATMPLLRGKRAEELRDAIEKLPRDAIAEMKTRARKQIRSAADVGAKIWSYLGPVGS